MEPYRKMGWVAVVVAALLGLATVHAQGRGAERQAEPESIRIGYAKTRLVDANLEDAQVAFRLWASELAVEWEEPVSAELRFFDDLPALVTAIGAGEIDLFAANSLDYLMIREQVPVEPCLLAEMGGAILDEYILLLRRGRELNGPSELSGLRLMIAPERFVNPLAMMWLDTLLMRHGLDEKETFFEALSASSGTSQPVLAVFFGQADIALAIRRLFGTLVELNPQLGQQLEVLAVSPPLLHGFACFPQDLDEAKKQLIREGGLNIHKSPRGRQILTLFGADELVAFDPAYLDGVTALVAEYDRLKAGSGDRRKQRSSPTNR